MGAKTCDDGFSLELWSVNDTEHELREVETYPGALACIVDALKKKGVRFDEVGLVNGDVGNLNHNIVVFRGDSVKLLKRALHGEPCRMSAHQTSQNGSLFVNGLRRLARGIHAKILKVAQIAHRRNFPNCDSATAGSRSFSKLLLEFLPLRRPRRVCGINFNLLSLCLPVEVVIRVA